MSTASARIAARRIKAINAEGRAYTTMHPGDDVAIAFWVEDPTDLASITVLARLTRASDDAEVFMRMTFSSASGEFTAPVVSFLTPTGVWDVNMKVCMHGVTHFHEDTYLNAVPVGLQVDMVFATLVSAVDRTAALSERPVGSARNPLPGTEIASGTREYNARHGLVCQKS
jgi:hypothetical protein